MVNWFSTRVPRKVTWESIGFSTNGVGTAIYPHGKEWSWNPISHRIEKLTEKRAKI